MSGFPVLLGDIGGTNARFAVLRASGAALVVLPRELTGSYPGPEAAIRSALRAYDGPPPRSAILAVATRVEAPVVRLTNAAWTVHAADLATALGLSRVTLVNDYTPVAAALAVLEDDHADHLVRLGPDLPRRTGARLVLGPGTGFGAAALLPAGGRWLVHATEAGHVEFGPTAPDEVTLWPSIEQVGGRITAETILSGPGLLRLYRALAHRDGAEPVCDVPNEVLERGRAGTEARAAEALRLFVRLLGRFAGDLALVFGATGGVFLASGIAPRIVDLLREPEFRAAFERKHPFEAWAGTVPSFVITHPEPALVGLSTLAQRPDAFLFEAHGASAE